MGKGKKQTIGYRYFLGMHQALCHGPIDKITRITVDDRTAWSGSSTGGRVNINAPELFGGESREGGVSGALDIEMGRPNQGQNSYLLSRLGNLIPAYRGIVAVVFRRAYLGNNPYLKPWRYRGQRVHVRQDGIEQWYDAKAGVYSDEGPSINLPQFFPVLTRFVDANYPEPPSLHPGSVTLGPYNREAQIVAGNPDGSGSCSADDFFVLNGVQLGTVAAQNYAAGTVLRTLGPGQTVTVRIRNTINPFSGVTGSLHVRFPGQLDLNAVHVIRECLTDPDWGMGYAEEDIDETTFRAAADTIFAERLGVSLLWDRQEKLETFIDEVKKHIDAAVYVSRKTGKYVIKLIRNDYVADDLLHLDESNISRIEDPSRTSYGELINSVTVQYWDSQTGKQASVTVTDTALVQVQGAVIGTTIEYPGFTTARNATIVCQRDLASLSTPSLSCTVFADSSAEDLALGDVFRMSWSRWQLAETPMRVTGIAYGDGKSKQVRINCVQDVFATPSATVVTAQPGAWNDPSTAPGASSTEIVGELPYYEIVQNLGETDANTKLTVSPDIGYLYAAASRPDSAINTRVWVDDGTGYEYVAPLDFAPSAILALAVDKKQTTFTVSDIVDGDQIVLGDFFQIGQELVRVDTLNEETGVLTVGRAVLDTAPQDHAQGAVLLFWDGYSGIDTTEYVAGEVLDVKLTAVNGGGVFNLDDAQENTVTFAQRATRPYPPANLKLNAEAYAADAVYDGEVTITWAHRDRLQQTSGILIDHTTGDIGPEDGTLYRVRGYVDGILVHTEDDIAGTTATWTPVAIGVCVVEVHAKRGALYSLYAPSHTFTNAGPRFTETNSARRTEQGASRVTEN